MAKTLLLADDSVTIQKVVGISFANEDVRLVTVDNGDDAVAKAREIRPDAILADVVMPGKNGYEVCEAIKAEPDLQHVPVLLLTGTFEAFDDERAQRAGAAGHVSKPFEAQALVQRVRELFAASPPAPSPAATAPQPEPSPVAQSAPSESSAGKAFDFFDEAGETSAPATRTPASPTPAGLVSPDEAFAFGDEELDSAAAQPAPSAFDSSFGTGGMPAAEIPEPVTRVDASIDEALSVPPIEPPAGDPIDLGPAPALTGDGDSIGNDDLAHATVIDPELASDFAVSSSDLGPPQTTAHAEAAPAGAPTQLLDDEGAAERGAATQLLQDLRDEIGARPPMDTAPGPAPPTGPAVSSEPDEEPIVDLLEPAPERSAAEPESSPLTPEAVSPGPDIDPEAILERIGPALRDQLHETLEKVAWDAFSQVTEKVVQQAVERVEQVAWEVVPQIAESLIREEIRKLKG